MADVVESVGSLYHSETVTEDQKGFLETMIGAAIWYLPVPAECWTGRISVEAIRVHHPSSGVQEPRLTADHEYPRKIAAADLLTRYSGGDTDLRDKLLLLYKSKYGKFNYITPSENRSLMRHQRRDAFVDPTTAYAKAGIELVAVTRTQLSRIRSRDPHVIAQVLQGPDS